MPLLIFKHQHYALSNADITLSRMTDSNTEDLVRAYLIAEHFGVEDLRQSIVRILVERDTSTQTIRDAYHREAKYCFSDSSVTQLVRCQKLCA